MRVTSPHNLKAGTGDGIIARKVRVKICGITSPDQAAQIAAIGVDAIGLVFYPSSPRYVELERARAIAMAVGPLVTVVGLFVDATRSNVEDVVQKVPLNTLQFHGNETAAFCRSFNRPVIKAIRMRKGLDLSKLMDDYEAASGFLLDAYKPGQPGGTGETFEWSRVPKRLSKPVILAGGLSPENVSGAIALTQPYAVDVSSGVETAPGEKDLEKVASFLQSAKLPTCKI